MAHRKRKLGVVQAPLPDDYEAGSYEDPDLLPPLVRRRFSHIAASQIRTELLANGSNSDGRHHYGTRSHITVVGPISSLSAAENTAAPQSNTNRLYLNPCHLPGILDPPRFAPVTVTSVIGGRENVPPTQPVSTSNTQAKSVIISSSMSDAEIVRHLVDKRCINVTSQLDLNKCEKRPKAWGGYADIFLGQLVTGIKVAIKCPRLIIEDSDAGKGMIKELAREIYTLSKLKHGNVLTLVGFAMYRDQLAIVSPWMENGTLHTYVSKHPDVDRFQLCLQMVAGLVYLHESGIVHGDIKAGNIFVSRDGTIKLGDFGNTRLKHYTLEFSGITSSPKITVRYTSPEILLGTSTYTKEADIYALGMTFLETLTGRVPWAGKLEPAVMNLVASGQTPNRPQELDAMEENQATALWSMMSQSWRKVVTERPSAAQIESTLTAALLD
ncbi:Ephrin type-A receptor 4 [Ceratobasidium sp. AG-Ba]|nr:Ephrin type-A receptor 4 [Ceratobasidium sp. AG-Ba]